LGRKGYVADGSHVCWGQGMRLITIYPLIMLCHFLCEVWTMEAHVGSG
jgi:hypothetical protein